MMPPLPCPRKKGQHELVIDSPRVAERHRHWREELRAELKEASLASQTLLAPCLALNALQTALHLMRLPAREIEMLDPPLQSKVMRFQENADRAQLLKMLAPFRRQSTAPGDQTVPDRLSAEPLATVEEHTPVGSDGSDEGSDGGTGAGSSPPAEAA
uniref:Uncharacterized protein n=1 Tax=Prymnesium polylepis TaxID=72548 RepID=A0A7S4I7E3_9EUKA|mmetsp:Transcript_27646/g.68277  ORF Transcript_27646/g.68277 Transcript_27646/m.68277 type:complete len:157 (+) Transcript_27646:1-471(+)